MINLPEYEARYYKAVAHEREVRDAAFLGVSEQLGGIALRPLTARDFLIHSAAESPFFTGEAPTVEDVAMFLWLQSVGFEKGNGKKHSQFVARIAKTVKPFELIDPIFQFVHESMMDKPAGDSSGDSKSYYSWVAAYVDALASRYGWSVEECMRQPLKITFQLLKAAWRAEGGSKAILFNPSEKIISEYLSSVNKRNGVSRRHTN